MSLWSDITGFVNRDIIKPVESAGSAIASGATDVGKFVTSHPLADLGIAASIALPFLAPEIGAGLGLGSLGADAAGAAAGGAADLGAAGAGIDAYAGIGGAGAGLASDAATTAATAGAPLDLLAGGTAAGTADTAGLGSVLAPTAGAGDIGGDLTAGTALADTTGLGLTGGTSALAFTPADSGISGAAGLPGAITSPGLGSATGAVSLTDAGAGGAGAGGFGDLSTAGTGGFGYGANIPGSGALEAATGAPAGGASTGSFLDSTANFFNKYGTLASLGVGAASIARQLLTKGALPQQGNLTNIAQQAGQQAGQLTGEGQTLLGPIQGGPLPPALEQQVQNALADAIATTKSRYAQLGLSGSTMEAQDIAYQQQQAEAERGTLATQLAQEGNSLIQQASNDLGIESGIYQDLMNQQVAQDNALSTSIANFAGAAANAFATQSRPVYNLAAIKANQAAGTTV